MRRSKKPDNVQAHRKRGRGRGAGGLQVWVGAMFKL